MEILILLLVLVVLVFAVGDIRRSLITKPVFAIFKRILPPMSDTEREAMEAGDVWWDGELFKGRPDWQKLLDMPQPKLTQEEQPSQTCGLRSRGKRERTSPGRLDGT